MPTTEYTLANLKGDYKADGSASRGDGPGRPAQGDTPAHSGSKERVHRAQDSVITLGKPEHADYLLLQQRAPGLHRPSGRGGASRQRLKSALDSGAEWP